MMDSTTAVVALIVLLLAGVLIGTRVLAAREDRAVAAPKHEGGEQPPA